MSLDNTHAHTGCREVRHISAAQAQGLHTDGMLKDAVMSFVLSVAKRFFEKNLQAQEISWEAVEYQIEQMPATVLKECWNKRSADPLAPYLTIPELQRVTAELQASETNKTVKSNSEAVGNPYLLSLSADVDEPGSAVAWVDGVGEVGEVGASGKLEILRTGTLGELVQHADGQMYEKVRGSDGKWYLMELTGKQDLKYMWNGMQWVPLQAVRRTPAQPAQPAQPAAGGGAQGTNFEVLGRRVLEQLQAVNKKVEELQKLEPRVKRLEDCRKQHGGAPGGVSSTEPRVLSTNPVNNSTTNKGNPPNTKAGNSSNDGTIKAQNLRKQTSRRTAP